MPATGNSASRMDNSVKYVSPALQGVTGELVSAPAKWRATTARAASRRRPGLRGGPLKLRLGYHNRNNDTAALKNLSSAKNTVLAASTTPAWSSCMRPMPPTRA